MIFSFFAPPRSDQQEILASRQATRAEIDANYAEIARVNRLLGGVSAARKGLDTLLAGAELSREITILDVAAGGADIPRALVVDARRGRFGEGQSLHITATDLDPEVVDFAHRETPSAEYAEITIESADALHLPYGDSTFDVATCNMALHHFEPDDCEPLLLEMARVSRIGFVVNDLRRSRLAASLAWLLSRVLGSHWITQNDAPLSVLRAYTPAEVCGMFVASKLPGSLVIRKARMFRVVAIYRHTSGGDFAAAGSNGMLDELKIRERRTKA
jgi:SAM-dependent methyltransferase